MDLLPYFTRSKVTRHLSAAVCVFLLNRLWSPVREMDNTIFNNSLGYILGSVSFFLFVVSGIVSLMKVKFGLSKLIVVLGLTYGIYALSDHVLRNGLAFYVTDWHYAGASMIAMTCGALVLYARILFTRKMVSFGRVAAVFVIPCILVMSAFALAVSGQINGTKIIVNASVRESLVFNAGGAAYLVQVLIYLWCVAALGFAAYDSFCIAPDYRRENSALKPVPFYLGLLSLMFASITVLFVLNSSWFLIVYRIEFFFSLFFISSSVISYHSYPKLFIWSDTCLSNSFGYRRSKIGDLDVPAVVDKMERIMTEQRLYCDEKLSLDTLASEVGITKHQLSEILNGNIKKNFNTYVNDFRIKEAVKILDRGGEETILSIAYRCGFNSKTTFNSLFFRHTGMTPSEYRRVKSQSAAAYSSDRKNDASCRSEPVDSASADNCRL